MVGYVFGSDVAFVMPKHGDFNCPCLQCLVARGIKAVEHAHSVFLSKCLNDQPIVPHSKEYQATFDKAVNIITIVLPAFTL
jgi:hypothetical protein